MEIQRTTRDGCLVVTFIGTIDLSSVPWIQRTLLKELSERPFANVEKAVDAAVARPPYLRDELLPAPTPTAPAAARAFVQQVCADWQLALPDETQLARAVLLANELVTNAVVHTHTDIRLRLELRGDRLHVGVRDGDPWLLRLVSPDTEAEGGRGLWLVEQLPRPGGVHHHPSGGKVGSYGGWSVR
jgi:hypothetical protein